jgi:hypothetical protein
MKKLLLIGILLLIFFPKIVDKIVLSEIQDDRPYNPAFETTISDEKEALSALDQPYTYFGQGGQAYVFFSEDKNYVLKFFKQRHFRKNPHRMIKDYRSYKIGYEQLPHETEIVYLHLNPTSHLKKSIKFKDRLGLSHTVDLDKTDFILQRRATLLYDKIDQQMAQNNLEGAKNTISSTLKLIQTIAKKGLHDNDPKISKNCGFVNNHAIKIDVGRFYHDERMKKPNYYKPELYHHTRSLRHWLLQNHPELIPHLDAEVLKVVLHE